jgi:hypothetical protein
MRARATVLVLVTLVACAPACTLSRRFLTACPASGPVRQTEFTLHLEPVAIDAYYDALAANGASFPRREVARVAAGGRELPIAHWGPMGTVGGHRLLVVAAVHGDEIAGSLAAPRLLGDLRDRPESYAGVEMHLLAPANPVGLAALSRYNGAGCDVNRDFRHFRTPEAAAIRDVLAAVAPQLVVSLHEGPQEGLYVIATRSVPADVAEVAARAVAAAGVPLATRSYFGLAIAGGAEREGLLMTFVKRALRVDSLGAYAQQRGIGTLTVESPWSSTDLERRVLGQVAAVRGAAGALRASSESPRAAAAGR